MQRPETGIPGPGSPVATKATGLAHLECQLGLALEEAADKLALQPVQVDVLQCFGSLLHAVLATGEDERVQVTLWLIADDVQV